MAKIFVSAKTKAKKVGVTRVDDTHFIVAVKEAPEKGKANSAIIKTLADFLGVPQSRLSLVSGHTGKKKVFSIID